MGRKRFVTSDISIDGNLEEVAEENPIAALMWPWFLTALDDWARMGGDPREIRNSVFQSFKTHYTKQDIEAAIALYQRHNLVHPYEVDGTPYLQFNPKAFYRLNSYIKRRNQEHDGSRIPPPRDHPWGTYWHTSDWDDTGRRKSATDNDE